MSLDIVALLEEFMYTEQYRRVREYQKRRAAEEAGMAMIPLDSASGHPLNAVFKQEFSKGRASALDEDPIKGLVDELKLEAKKDRERNQT